MPFKENASSLSHNTSFKNDIILILLVTLFHNRMHNRIKIIEPNHVNVQKFPSSFSEKGNIMSL